MSTEASTFNIWLKQRRRALDLTQEDLAEQVGCSTITIQKIELGERRPSKQVAQRLAECLKVPDEERDSFISFARGEHEAMVGVASPAVTPSAVVAPPPPTPIPNNLPIPLTRLIGRGDVVEAACNYVLYANVRLLTLTGVPGIGKTRLSIDVAARLLPRFEGGVFFVELAAIGAPELVAPTISIALGRKEAGNISHLDWLKQFIGNRRILLVLDNFEQVLDAAPLVMELLRACPALTVLVTSREALHVAGEQQLPVQPLAMPTGPYDGSLARSSSMQLFVERARAVDHAFTLTEDNYETVAAICTQLEGLPLAIELAAARIKMLTPEDLLSRLVHRLKVLTGGPRHLPPRMQTLRGAIDWSYRLLNPDEQRMFTCLGVFVGGATLPAIEAVYVAKEGGAGALECVGSLVDKNLLRREARRSRYTMLEMVREYALEKLHESGEIADIRQSHSRYFLEFAERENDKIWSPEEAGGLDRLEEEHDNLRAVLQLCASSQAGLADAAIGLRLVAVLTNFWEVRGYRSEGRERIASMLSTAGAKEPEVKTLRAWALQQAATFAYWHSDFSAQRLALEEELALFREAEDQTGIAWALTSLGTMAMGQGNLDTASLSFGQSLSLFKDIGDTSGAMSALSLLAWAEMRPGHFEQARVHLEESLALGKQVQNPSHVAAALALLGEVMVRQGDYERATALLEESLEMRRAAGYKWGIAAALGTLGWASLCHGDLARASSLLLESLALRQQLSDPGGIAWCLEKLAEVETANNHPVRAAHMLGAAETLRHSNNSVVDLADQPDYERTLATLRGQLDEQGFEAAWQEGGAMSLERIVSYALTAR